MPPKRTLDPVDVDEAERRRVVMLPTLSHLQFLVLDLMPKGGGISSQELQSALLAVGVDHRGPKFYQLMARLEDGGFIEAKQQAFSVAGGEVLRTVYTMTNEARVAWAVTREFYGTRLKAKQVLE